VLTYDEMANRIFYALPAWNIKHLAIKAKLTAAQATAAIAYIRQRPLEYRWTIGHAPRRLADGNKFFVILLDREGEILECPDEMLSAVMEGHCQTLTSHATQNLNQSHALRAMASNYDNHPMIKKMIRHQAQQRERTAADDLELAELISEVTKKAS